ASISLHAGESLEGGRQASTEPRVGLFHQARFSGIAGRQVTGRTHRDHQVSPWHIAYAQGTVEEQVSKVMVERIAAASDTVGGDAAGLTAVAQLLGADWLPAASLTEGGGGTGEPSETAACSSCVPARQTLPMASCIRALP